MGAFNGLWFRGLDEGLSPKENSFKDGRDEEEAPEYYVSFQKPGRKDRSGKWCMTLEEAEKVFSDLDSQGRYPRIHYDHQ